MTSLYDGEKRGHLIALYLDMSIQPRGPSCIQFLARSTKCCDVFSIGLCRDLDLITLVSAGMETGIKFPLI